MASFPVGTREPLPFPDHRTWQYLNPATMTFEETRLLTLIEMPRSLSMMKPREASPTGKSGMGIAMHAQPQQAIFKARPMPLTRQETPRILFSGKLMNTAMVDPYSILKSQQTEMSAKKSF